MLTWKPSHHVFNGIAVGPNEVKFEFPGPLKFMFDHYEDKEIFNDKLVAYVLQPFDHPTQCLYGINSDCKISWELNKDNYLNLKYAFRQPFLDKEKKLWIVNLGGKQYQIDPATGKVLDTKFEDFDFDIDGDTITINGHEHKLPAKIFDIFPYKDTLLVLTELKNNVYGFGLDGKMRWDLIEANRGNDKIFSPGIFGRELLTPGFIDFDDNHEMQLKICDVGVIDTYVDHVTGKVLFCEFVR